MSIHVAITHYERPAMLKRLVRQLIALAGDGRSERTLDMVVHVYDDHSSVEAFQKLGDVIDPTYRGGRVDVHRESSNRGREGFWRIINRAVGDFRNGPGEFFLLLQDDFRLEHDFFTRLWHAWYALPYGSLALNPLIFEAPPTPRWTDLRPTLREFKSVRVWETGWLDCYMFSDRTLWQCLNYEILPIPTERFRPGGKASSGVGEQITNRIGAMGKARNVYAVTETLIRHGGHRSVMHPGHRSRFKMSN